MSIEQNITLSEFCFIKADVAEWITESNSILLNLQGTYTVFLVIGQLPGFGMKPKRLVIQRPNLEHPCAETEQEEDALPGVVLDFPSTKYFTIGEAQSVDPKHNPNPKIWSETDKYWYWDENKKLNIPLLQQGELIEYKINIETQTGQIADVMERLELVFFDSADFKTVDEVMEDINSALKGVDEYEKLAPMIQWISSQLQMMSEYDEQDFDHDEDEWSEDLVEVSPAVSTLILIRGLPGSGKTSLANRISPLNTCADEFFMNEDGQYDFDPSLLPDAHQWCLHNTGELLALTQEDDEIEPVVVVHNTFSMRWEIEPYLQAFGRHHRIHVIDLFDGGLSDSELFNRNIHGVPLKGIQAMRSRWEHDWRNGNPERGVK